MGGMLVPSISLTRPPLNWSEVPAFGGGYSWKGIRKMTLKSRIGS